MEHLISLLQQDSNAANAFGALASAAAAVLALVVTIISAIVAYLALRAQQKHNRLSVSPLPAVTTADYEDSLRVKVRNNGTGPMIIRQVSVTNGKKSEPSLIAWMPTLPSSRPWNHFASDLAGFSLLPKEAVILVEFTQFPHERDFDFWRDKCRETLGKLTVHVEFTDIYGTNFPAHTQSLSWFHRNTPKETAQDAASDI